MALTARTVSSHLTDYDQIKKLYHNAFPEDELVKWSRLMRKSRSNNVEFLAYYDQNELVGFTYVIQQRHVNFLFFLAVVDQLRSKGYDGQIIDWLRAKYADTPLVLEIETPDSQAQNASQRTRRLQFYQRHGFRDSGHRVQEGPVGYTVLSDDDSFAIENLAKAYHWFWRPFFRRQNIHIQ